MEPAYVVVRNVLKPWLGTWFKWTIEGLENVPESGPAILAFNHIAYLDPFAAAYVADLKGRRPRFLVKSELFQDKRIGWLLRAINQIEVKRGTREAPMALDHALAALRRGELIVIFPEGTITDDPDLNPTEPKSGAARLALESGVPIIPAAVWGTQNIWPKGYAKHWRPRQDLLVRIGEPMQTSGDPSDRRAWKELGAELMDRIAILAASLRPVVPDRRRTKRTAA